MIHSKADKTSALFLRATCSCVAFCQSKKVTKSYLENSEMHCWIWQSYSVKLCWFTLYVEGLCTHFFFFFCFLFFYQVYFYYWPALRDKIVFFLTYIKYPVLIICCVSAKRLKYIGKCFLWYSQWSSCNTHVT